MVGIGYDVSIFSFVVLFLSPRLIVAANNEQADRTEPYTRITPFQEKHDTSIECVLAGSFRVLLLINRGQGSSISLLPYPCWESRSPY